jgi:hypothetical protein
MYVYNFFLRIADTMTSQNIDLSLLDILYSLATECVVKEPKHAISEWQHTMYSVSS